VTPARRADSGDKLSLTPVPPADCGTADCINTWDGKEVRRPIQRAVREARPVRRPGQVLDAIARRDENSRVRPVRIGDDDRILIGDGDRAVRGEPERERRAPLRPCEQQTSDERDQCECANRDPCDTADECPLSNRRGIDPEPPAETRPCGPLWGDGRLGQHVVEIIWRTLSSRLLEEPVEIAQKSAFELMPAPSRRHSSGLGATCRRSGKPIDSTWPFRAGCQAPMRPRAAGARDSDAARSVHAARVRAFGIRARSHLGPRSRMRSRPVRQARSRRVTRPGGDDASGATRQYTNGRGGGVATPYARVRVADRVAEDHPLAGRWAAIQGDLLPRTRTTRVDPSEGVVRRTHVRQIRADGVRTTVLGRTTERHAREARRARATTTTSHGSRPTLSGSCRTCGGAAIVWSVIPSSRISPFTVTALPRQRPTRRGAATSVTTMPSRVWTLGIVRARPRRIEVSLNVEIAGDCARGIRSDVEAVSDSSASASA
jgi:hypothetical protein